MRVEQHESVLLSCDCLSPPSCLCQAPSQKKNYVHRSNSNSREAQCAYCIMKLIRMLQVASEPDARRNTPKLLSLEAGTLHDTPCTFNKVAGITDLNTSEEHHTGSSLFVVKKWSNLGRRAVRSNWFLSSNFRPISLGKVLLNPIAADV